jgi:hypothetical protein
MSARRGLLLALLALALWPAVARADGPVAPGAATCADYPN